MAKTLTLADLKAAPANELFFSEGTTKFFGDNLYTMVGHRLIVDYKRETSDRRIVNEQAHYVADQETLELHHIIRDKKKGKWYYYREVDGVVKTQYITERGLPDGDPTDEMPSHSLQSRGAP
jgi:hypothetical protein